MEIDDTHHPEVCLPLAWRALAPLPSWLLVAAGGTRIRKILSWEPMLALTLQPGQGTMNNRISELERYSVEISSPTTCLMQGKLK
jgi:hypothetical protein